MINTPTGTLHPGLIVQDLSNAQISIIQKKKKKIFFVHALEEIHRGTALHKSR